MPAPEKDLPSFSGEVDEPTWPGNLRQRLAKRWAKRREHLEARRRGSVSGTYRAGRTESVEPPNDDEPT